GADQLGLRPQVPLPRQRGAAGLADRARYLSESRAGRGAAGPCQGAGRRRDGAVAGRRRLRQAAALYQPRAVLDRSVGAVIALPHDPIFDPVAIVTWAIDTGIFDLMYSAWGWPIAEIVHFIGICLLIGAVGTFDLRMIGFARGLSLEALHKLLPFGVLGFLLSADRKSTRLHSS